jgi:hypothetical protein
MKFHLSPPSWAELAEASSYDLNHRPGESAGKAGERPPLRGVRRAFSRAYKGVVLAIFFAFLFGLIRGLLRL